MPLFLIGFAIIWALLPLNWNLPDFLPSVLRLVAVPHWLLLILLLVFYLRYFQQRFIISALPLMVCAIANFWLLAAAIIGMYQPMNASQVLRWTIVIWTVPLLTHILNVYHYKKVGYIALLIISIHALWGIVQFLLQDDIGLYRFGETNLSLLPGIATFSINTIKIIRSYGPYQHPNIFGASMVLGLYILLHLDSKKSQKIIVFYKLIFLALILSFSRQVWGATLLTLFFHPARKIFTTPLLAVKNTRTQLLIALLLFFLLSPLIIFRLQDRNDRAVSERIEGIEWNLQLLRQLPWYRGAGLGQYRIALHDFLVKGKIIYQPWQIDHVHSVPLLIVAEAGVLLSLSLLIFIVYLGRRYRQLFKEIGILTAVTTPLWLFDHYLFTQSAPLLWWFLALAIGWQTRAVHSSAKALQPVD